MSELYKKRQLSDNLGDTFLFFKNYGKNFLKIFFIINGAFLLLFGIIIYFLIKINFELLKTSGFENNISKEDFLSYFNNNEGLVFLLIFICFFLFLLLSLFNYSYPVLYLKMLSTGKKNFVLNTVLAEFTKHLFKLIKFTIGFVFIILPVLMILLIVLFLLCFIIIGIPLLMIGLPTCFTYLNLCFYSYLTDEKRFFESLRHSYYLIKIDFWNTVGTSFIMMLIMQFVQAATTMFFYFVGIFIFLASLMGTSDQNHVESIDPSPLLIAFVTVIVLVFIVISNILNNIIIINQGMIYYSLEAGNKAESNTIDLIGDHSNE